MRSNNHKREQAKQQKEGTQFYKLSQKYENIGRRRCVVTIINMNRRSNRMEALSFISCPKNMRILFFNYKKNNIHPEKTKQMLGYKNICSTKQIFLKTSPNSQEDISALIFFRKIAGLHHGTLLNKESCTVLFM